MYIPTVFFSEGTESEFLVASGGLETTWVSGSYIWKSHIFLPAQTGSFVVTSGNTDQAQILLVAGGGSRGGNYDGGDPGPVYFGGGGGAGGMLQYSNQSIFSGSYQLVVGTAQPSEAGPSFDGLDGGFSSFSGNSLSFYVTGGGGGGRGLRNGYYGGSGGGGGGGASPGSGIPGQGFGGGPSFYLGYADGGGPGGGAGASGTSNLSGDGGIGRQSTLYYGVNAYYAGGGKSLRSRLFPTWASDPFSYDGLGLYGRGGGTNSDNSTGGIVIIAYPFKRVSTLKTELARFTPTIASGTLEYIEAVSGELRQYNFTTSASIDLCIVSGSQYNAYDINYRDIFVDSSIPSVYSNVTKTTLSINSCL